MEEPLKLLRTWGALNKWLSMCKRSEEVLPLLRLAIRHRVRPQVVQRVHQRFNRLRSKEEQQLLLFYELPKYLRSK